MNVPSSSKLNEAITFEDEDIFDDSLFLAKFNESPFKEATAGQTSFNRSNLNVSALCCDEEISGYDKLLGRTWIYPTNYPVRDYQFNIIKASLIKNTLVSLPTGLGKTFIAAVVMYNFFRWYPLGKIVFMAPTRPLVAQQIDACYNIVAIPPDDTVEMTGTMHVNTRKTQWQSKRVFFATPQVIFNDIQSGICPADKIRCLVFDEAHRARGNYAYCSIIGALTGLGHKTFRVLALSATPGSKVDDVVKVVTNLHIAHLELRTEGCIDVAPYSHSRKITTLVIKLDEELTLLRNKYVEILDGYARRLKQLNILPHNVGNLSKGRIVMLYKEYQNKERGARHPQHNWIMKDFTVLIALYHGLELLVKHGSRVFLNFFDDHPEKSWIQSDDQLTALLERLRDDLGVNPLSLNRSVLPDGTIPEIPKDLCFGHPKFEKLKEIMVDHFKRASEKGQDTRAIVFCEYRESVNLVHCLLLQCRPLIKAQMFVGQGASGKEGVAVVSSKQQARVMSQFVAGACNALVATCVAEEGLDCGSVDLILCFDIANSSPVRLVQRCGRTGRERGGQVYILVTEGREHQTLTDCMRQRDGLNRKVLQSKEVENNLYQWNPRMMPHDFTPQCQKMYITVVKKIDPKEKKDSATKSKKSQKDLRSMLLGKNLNATSESSLHSPYTSRDHDANASITKEEFNELFPEGLKTKVSTNDIKEFWNLSYDSLTNFVNSDQNPTNLSTWLEWQRTLQKTVNIGHTRDSQILSEVLQYSDAKRFDVPASTQAPAFNTQDIATQNIVSKSSPIKTKAPNKKKSKIPLIKSPVKKDGDIRALFSTATKSMKNYTKVIKDLGIPNDGSVPTNLIDLLVDLSLDNAATANKCYLCRNIGDCSLFKSIRKTKITPPMTLNFLKNPILPDVDLLDDIDLDALERFTTKKNDDSQELHEFIEFELGSKNNRSTNFDLEFDFDLPQTVDEFKVEQSDKHFDIGNIEDIFAESSPEEVIEKNLSKIEADDKTNNPKNALGFFGLDSIEDIFADSDDSVHSESNKVDEAENLNESNVETVKCDDKIIDADEHSTNNERHSPVEYPLSPSLLSGSRRKNIPTSPILCSQSRKPKLSTIEFKAHSSTPIVKPQPVFHNTTSNNKNVGIIDDIDFTLRSASNTFGASRNISLANTSNKSMFTITQLINMINKPNEDHPKLNKGSHKEESMILTQIQQDCNERSPSPILLTQAEKKKNSLSNSKDKNLQIRINDSLIVLDSDSESEHTQEYDINDLNTEMLFNKTKNTATSRSPLSTKRKFDEDDENISASPYFNKRLKLEECSQKPLTLQEKIIVALSNNKPIDDTEKDKEVNYAFISPVLQSQKENLSPKMCTNGFTTKNNKPKNNASKKLSLFKHDPKTPFSSKFQEKSCVDNINKAINSQKRKLSFDDSDDDFVMDDKRCPSPKIKRTNEESFIVNHKKRKKKKNKNEFLELEAELSDNSNRDSGDELSDDSVGSIIDFICDDENVTVQEDMHAHYLKSVKSPVKGVFKIPQLPTKYKDVEILSQYVEEDSYEMDSFCVDSHIGLTQVNEVSELELAEQLLEKKRKCKRKKMAAVDLSTGDSPVIKRKNKVNIRRISSDSDSS